MGPLVARVPPSVQHVHNLKLSIRSPCPFLHPLHPLDLQPPPRFSPGLIGRPVPFETVPNTGRNGDRTDEQATPCVTHQGFAPIVPGRDVHVVDRSRRLKSSPG
eukprot:scaffold24_cov341-Pavlova_lutheri.AAC.27